MSQPSESPQTLLDEVLAGDNRELQLLAADGFLPIARDELVRVQIVLSRSADAEIAGRAIATIQKTEPGVLASVVSDADEKTLQLLIERVPHPTFLDAVLQRRNLPLPILLEMARWVPEELQEVVLRRQEDIRAHPEILEALESNPYLTPFTQRLIAEFRQYLLPRRPREPKLDVEDLEELPREVVEEALREAAENVPRAGDVDELTGLTENQIRSLPTSVRIHLAFGATRTLRNILLKDGNPQVALTALNRSAISEREIEQLCRSRTISDDVLVEITNHREWISKYRILLAVIKNPRTPLRITMQLVTRVHMRDLKVLQVDRNIPDALRGRARILYRQKQV